MNDLRTEIREAFEKEQSAFPPAPALRHEIVHAVAMHRPSQFGLPSRPDLQWLAVAAAILVTAALIAGLLAVRIAQRPVPVKDYGPPPAGVPLIYLVDPRQPTWLQGYDWQGHARGTIKLPAPADPEASSVTMAPDGGAFKYLPGNGLLYLDRFGRPIRPGLLPDTSGHVSETWADDNRHLCFVNYNQVTNDWSLITKLPGEADRFVAAVAHFPFPGDSMITLAACSFKSDLAVLVQNNRGLPSALWTVRLSDGKAASHHTYYLCPNASLVGRPPCVGTANVVNSVVVSPDGAYVAESSTPADGPSSEASAVIRLVSSWQAAATLPGSIPVKFSGDGTRMFAFTPSTSEFQVSRPRIVDWGSGEVWQYDGPESLEAVAAEPGGEAFAIALSHSYAPPCPPGAGCQATPDPLNDILIVHSDGSTTEIPGRYKPTW